MPTASSINKSVYKATDKALTVSAVVFIGAAVGAYSAVAVNVFGEMIENVTIPKQRRKMMIGASIGAVVALIMVFGKP